MGCAKQEMSRMTVVLNSSHREGGDALGGSWGGCMLGVWGFRNLRRTHTQLGVHCQRSTQLGIEKKVWGSRFPPELRPRLCLCEVSPVGFTSLQIWLMSTHCVA